MISCSLYLKFFPLLFYDSAFLESLSAHNSNKRELKADLKLLPCVFLRAGMCRYVYVYAYVERRLLTVSFIVGKDFNYSGREFIIPFGENYEKFYIFITYVINNNKDNYYKNDIFIILSIFLLTKKIYFFIY